MRIDFYSHAPCGARLIAPNSHLLFIVFLLTRPMRGATIVMDLLSIQKEHFYSHAPCGARRAFKKPKDKFSDFYSHAPCGARQNSFYHSIKNAKFLLTRPMRGATSVRNVKLGDI